MNYWRCDACDRANPMTVLVCEGCGSPLPRSYDRTPLPRRRVTDLTDLHKKDRIPTRPKPSETGRTLR